MKTGIDGLWTLRTSGHSPGDGLGGRLSSLNFDGWRPLITTCELPWVIVDALCAREAVEYTLEYSFDLAQYRLTVIEPGGAETTGNWTTVSDSGLVLAGNYWIRIVIDGDPGRTGVDVIRPFLEDNNEIGHGNTTAAQRADAGHVQYACVMLYAHEAMTIDSIQDYYCKSSMEYAIEDVSDDFETVSIPNRTTAPVGVVFSSTPLVPSLSLSAGGCAALWIKTTQAAGMVDVGMWKNIVEVNWTSGLGSFALYLGGAFVAADSNYSFFIVFGTTGNESVGGSLLGYGSDLPVRIPISLPGPGVTDTYRLRVSKLNEYALYTLDEWLGHLSISVDEAGEVSHVPPPSSVLVTDIGGGYLRVESVWSGSGSIDWNVSWSGDFGASGDEDIAGGPPTNQYGDWRLSRVIGPFAWGEIYDVSVSVTQGTATSETLSATGTCLSFTRGMGAGLSSRASMRGIGGNATSDTQSWDGGSAGAESGQSSINLDAEYVWAQSNFIHHRILLPWDIVNDDIVGSGNDPIVEDGGKYYLCAGGVRVVEIDPVAGTFTCAAMDILDEADMCPVDRAVHETADRTYWQVFDLVTWSWKTFMVVDSDGTVYVAYDVDNE